MKSTAAADSSTVEQSLERIEALVAKMETGNLPLDEVIVTFEEGIKLVRDCRDKLTATEKRIQILISESEGARALADFEEA